MESEGFNRVEEFSTYWCVPLLGRGYGIFIGSFIGQIYQAAGFFNHHAGEHWEVILLTGTLAVFWFWKQIQFGVSIQWSILLCE